MKIRSGFVSNSSSSSFIVKAFDAAYKPKKGERGINIFAGWKSLLTKTQIEALKQFGFRMTWANSPSQVPASREEWDKHEASVLKELKVKDGFKYNWGYEVTCNQDEVLQFLVQNGIPFSADEHYGHRSVFFDGDDKVVVAINFGTIMSMYGVNEKMDVTKPVQTFTKKQYLKKVSW